MNVHMAGKVGAEAVECIAIVGMEPKGVSLDANTAPAPTKSTTSVKLAVGAEKATTTMPKALEPWAESIAWSRLKMPAPPLL
jgi:hypothetical protein